MKQRRVGTFTLAIILIFLGIAIPLSLFWGDRFGFILRFAPLALVALGVEVLISAIRKKDEKLAYDGLSIFLTIVITVVTIFSATVIPFVSRGFEYSRDFQKFRQSYSVELVDELWDNGIDASVWLHGDSWFDNWYLESGEMQAYVSVDIKGDQNKDLELAKDELVKAARIAVKNERVANVSVSGRYKSNDESVSVDINISAVRVKRLSDNEIKEEIDFNLAGSGSEYYYSGEKNEITVLPDVSSEIIDDGVLKGEESNTEGSSTLTE